MYRVLARRPLVSLHLRELKVGGLPSQRRCAESVSLTVADGQNFVLTCIKGTIRGECCKLCEFEGWQHIQDKASARLPLP